MHLGQGGVVPQEVPSDGPHAPDNARRLATSVLAVRCSVRLTVAYAAMALS